ncbi:MAG: acyl carrier protein [Rubrivivax sp.]
MSSLQELQALIHKKYGIEPSSLDPEASMREHGIDSLALVEFLFDVEDHFKVSLEGHTEVDTLAGLARVIDELRAAQTA